MKRISSLIEVFVFIFIILLGVSFNGYGQSIRRAAFDTIDRGLYSGYELNTGQHILEIYKKEDWNAFWKEHTSRITPAPLLPEIDFEDYFIIVAMDEMRSSGGYSLEIKEVTIYKPSDNSSGKSPEEIRPVTVTVQLVHPGSAMQTIAVLTRPYHIIRVRK